MKPLISLITPVYNTKESWLRECLDSVLNQTFEDWELCLCDNGSKDYINNILQEYRKKDLRVRLTKLSINEGGYKGLQAALDISSGSYVGLLDSDDMLPSFALNRVAWYLSTQRPDVAYTDEFIVDGEGKAILPFYKPEFNRDLLCFLHYFGHLTIYRSAVIKRLQIRHCGGSYDYDLALRASELNGSFLHIPEILYHYRTYPESTSSITREDCMYGGLKTLQEHIDLWNLEAVASIEGSLYKVTFKDESVMKPHLPEFNIEGDHLMKRLFNI
jgi:glycosyltransferase involved in cell wall biosynthesis